MLPVCKRSYGRYERIRVNVRVHVCAYVRGQQQAGEWAAHCLPFSLQSETLPRRSLPEPFTAITKDSQKQDVGQAGAAIAWPWVTDSVPALCKPARSSCVVIWSHT